MEKNPAECARLVDALSINYSLFFRCPHIFSLLEERIFPDLLSRKTERGALRVWSAGCACGEEAYSLAIILHNLLKTARKGRSGFGLKHGRERDFHSKSQNRHLQRPFPAECGAEKHRPLLCFGER
jgi:hypothetical protein